MFLPLFASYPFFSVNSVIAKYGRRWGHFCYGLVLASAVAGVALNAYALIFFGSVLIGSGIIIVLTAMFKLKEQSEV